MPDYHASATRWLRQVVAPTLTPTYASASAAAEALRQLKLAAWRMLPREIVAVLPVPHTDAAAAAGALDNYDAYLLCGEHEGVAHRASAGLACYRVALPPAAVGGTLSAVAIAVSGDPYNLPGARIAIATSASATPSDDWDVIREGSAYAAAAAPRTASTDGKTWYPGAADLSVEPAGGLVLDAYLYIYISLERYDRSRAGWLEGSSKLVPDFLLSFAAALAGLEDGDSLGGGYEGLSLEEIGASGTVSVSGGVVPGLSHAGLPTDTREACVSSFDFPFAAPGAPSSPAAAWSAMRALLSAQGAQPATAAEAGDGWAQLGLACRVTHSDASPTERFTQRLVYLFSALACHLSPSSIPPTLLLLINEGPDSVSLLGAEVWLRVFWASGQLLTLAQVGRLAAKGDAVFGAQTLSDDGASAILLGEAQMPPLMTAGEGVAIALEPAAGRHGTLMIIPSLTSLTAGNLGFGEYAGIGISAAADPAKITRGWMPKVLSLA
jgi:hypothetical protein